MLKLLFWSCWGFITVGMIGSLAMYQEYGDLIFLVTFFYNVSLGVFMFHMKQKKDWFT